MIYDLPHGSWVRALPPRDTHSNIGKYVLGRMAEEKDLLPREVIHQAKVAAVAAPLAEWYSGPLRADVQELMRHLPFEPRPAYIDSLLRSQLSERFYAWLIGRQSNNLVSMSHGIQLLLTYASFSRHT